MKKSMMLIVMFFIGIVFIGCTEPKENTSLKIDSLEIVGEENIYVGETLMLKVKEDASVIWTVENTDTVTVDSDGKVTAIKEGYGVVKATLKDDEKIYAHKIIKVLEKEVVIKEISIEGKDTINVGEYSYLKIKGDNYTNENIVWKSSDEAVVTVSDSIVYGIGEGSAIITATIEGTEVYSEKIINVIDEETNYESIYINGNRVFKVGEEEQFEAIIYPKKNEDVQLKWESSDEKVIRIDEKGSAIAVGSGNANIKVTVVGTELTAIIKIAVLETPSATGVKVTHDKVYVGSTVQLYATVYPEGASQIVRWKSRDIDIAVVDENGLVTGKKAGVASIEVSPFGAYFTTVFKLEVFEAYDEAIEPVSLEISGSDKLTVGYNGQYRVICNPKNANPAVRWESTNEKILRFDENENGMAIPVSSGTVRIRAISLLDETVKSPFFTVEVENEGCGRLIPDLRGYKVQIMVPSSSQVYYDPFSDYYPFSDKAFKQYAWKTVKKEYNCDIQIISYGNDAPWGASRIDYIASGNDHADLYMIESSWIREIVKKNSDALVVLNEYIYKYRGNQIPKYYLNAGGYQGKIYSEYICDINALPYVDLGLYYNLAWIEELGVEEPAKLFNTDKWHYNEFVNWCLEVQKKLGSYKGEYAVGGHSYSWLLGLTNATGVSIMDLCNGVYSIDVSEVQMAATLVNTLVKNKVFDTNETWAENDGGFVNGKTVMTTGHFWFVNNESRWTEDMFGEDTRYGYVPFPYPDHMSKSDVTIGLNEKITTFVYSAARFNEYPVGVRFEDVYQLFMDLQSYEESAEEGSLGYYPKEELKKQLSEKLDSEESIEAVMWFDESKVIFDASAEKDTNYFDLYKEALHDILINGADIDSTIDKIKNELIWWLLTT